jgi:hypothetical protein
MLFAVLQLVTYSMVRNYVSNSSAGPGYSGKKVQRLYGALRGVNIVYVILICVYCVLGLLTLDIRYSHEFPPTGPIGIQSARSGFEAWGLVLSGSVVFVPALVLIVLFLSRKNYHGKLAVFAVIIVLSVMHLFVLMTIMYSRGTANQPGYPNSLANHPLRCCAGDVAAHPLSQCDNPLAVCVFPVAAFPTFVGPLSSHDIPSNATHTLIFVCMLLFLIMDGVILVIVFVVHLGGDIQKTIAATTTAINAFIPSQQQYAKGGNGPMLLPVRAFSLNSKTD